MMLQLYVIFSGQISTRIVVSSIISLISLSRAFTMNYSRYKMGAMEWYKMAPLFVSNALQVISRAIAVTAFTISYNEYVYIVLVLYICLLLVINYFLKSPEQSIVYSSLTSIMIYSRPRVIGSKKPRQSTNTLVSACGCVLRCLVFRFFFLDFDRAITKKSVA